MNTFSLLIAHYNSGDFFEACYHSIINQDFSIFEVIIVDDCSTDGSFEKVISITKGDSRFKIFRNSVNHGVGFTKAECIQLAEGQYCGFLDPDDALAKNAISKSVRAYEKNPAAVATYSKFYICDKDLKICKPFPNTKKADTSYQYFFNIQFEIAHFFTFKKSVYELTEGIRTDLKISEDIDLYLKLSEKGKFHYIKEELYFYRVHEKGLSHSQEKVALKQSSWHDVLLKAAKRRNIKKIGKHRIEDIENLPKFIFDKENTFLRRVLRKYARYLH